MPTAQTRTSLLGCLITAFRCYLWIEIRAEGRAYNIRYVTQNGRRMRLARYIKLQDAHAPGMPGTFFPPPRASDPDMHHGTFVTIVPWCIPGSLTSGFLWSGWRGKRPRHSRCMRNPRFYLSGMRPMDKYRFVAMALCSHFGGIIHRTCYVWRLIKINIRSSWTSTSNFLIPTVSPCKVRQKSCGKDQLNAYQCTTRVLQLRQV